MTSRRTTAKATAQAIADFWAWWAGHAERAAEQVEAQELRAFAAELHPRVMAINPDLVWELTEPVASRYALVVSSGGIAELRPTAERWLRAGPGRSELWEFHAARPPNPTMFAQPVRLGDHALDLAHLEFGVRFDAQRARLDIQAYHPDFAFMPEDARAQVTFLALDWALGEDAVARWIGLPLPVEEPPMDGIPAPSLSSLVDQLGERYAETGWTVMTGLGRRRRQLLALVRFPLRRVDFPLYDEHIAVSAPYRDRTEEGLPGTSSLAALRELEDRLTAAAGSRAVLLVNESSAGTRTFHFYTDGRSDPEPEPGPETGPETASEPASGPIANPTAADSTAGTPPAGSTAEAPASEPAPEVETFDDLRAALREAASGWGEGRTRVKVSYDPGWNDLEPFMT